MSRRGYGYECLPVLKKQIQRPRPPNTPRYDLLTGRYKRQVYSFGFQELLALPVASYK